MVFLLNYILFSVIIERTNNLLCDKTFIRGVDFFKDFCYTNIDRARLLGNAVFGIPSAQDLCQIDRARALGNAVPGIPWLRDLCHFYFFKRNGNIKSILLVLKLLYLKLYRNNVIPVLRVPHISIMPFANLSKRCFISDAKLIIFSASRFS